MKMIKPFNPIVMQGQALFMGLAHVKRMDIPSALNRYVKEWKKFDADSPESPNPDVFGGIFTHNGKSYAIHLSNEEAGYTSLFMIGWDGNQVSYLMEEFEDKTGAEELDVPEDVIGDELLANIFTYQSSAMPGGEEHEA